MSIVTQTGLYGLVAGLLTAPLVVSFNLVYGTTRVFHFPHATLCLAGVYFAWSIGTAAGLPVWAAVALGTCAASLLSVLLAQWLYVPLILRRTSELGLLMAALGLFLVLEHFIVMCFRPDPHLFLNADAAQLLDVAGIRLTSVQAGTASFALFSVLVLWLLVNRTRTGLQVRAYASAPEVARAIGIHEPRVILWTFAIATAFGAVTMFGQTAYSGIFSPEDSMRGAIAAAACSAVFGTRRPFLGIAAATVLGIGQAFCGLLLGSVWQDSFALVLLVLGLTVRRRVLMEVR